MTLARRKVIVQAGVFAVLGAIVNIAVAWACALWATPIAETAGYIPYAIGHHRLSDNDRAFLNLAGWSPTDATDFEEFELFCYPSAGFGVLSRKIEELSTPKSTWRSKWGEDSHYYVRSRNVGREVKTGWPSFGLRGVRWNAGGWHKPEEFRSFAIIGTPAWARNWQQDQRYVPYAPLWPGFAINTIFYAAILWLLFAAPGFIRRRIRIKRGLCPACAYPVGETATCTECGKPVLEIRPRNIESAA